MATNNSIKQNDFKQMALEVVEIFELSIKYVGFPQSEMKRLEKFYNTKFDEEAETIKKRIMRVQYEFMGSTNFKDREDPKNVQLFKILSNELEEIRTLLDKYPA